MRTFGVTTGSVLVAYVFASLGGKALAQTSTTCSAGSPCFTATNNLGTSTSSGYKGVATGTGNGLEGLAGAGYGVYGSASATSATSAGVAGVNSSGYGGYFSASSGIGVYGVSGSGTGVLGNSNTNNGVQGSTSGAWPTAGVVGTSMNGGGTGVRGNASAGTGVFGTSASTGTGMYGENLLGPGYGVFGYNNSTGFAVYGLHNNNGGGSGHGYAGYFSGDVSVIAGVLTATVVPPSDGRLKKDIKDSPYGLAQLLKLRPVSYRWKSTTEDPGVQVGLIAQEVRGVVPEVIHTDGSTGMLAALP